MRVSIAAGASATPSAPPARANRMLSASSWRAIRPRKAPSASRVLISRAREVPRARRVRRHSGTRAQATSRWPQTGPRAAAPADDARRNGLRRHRCGNPHRRDLAHVYAVKGRSRHTDHRHRVLIDEDLVADDIRSSGKLCPPEVLGQHSSRPTTTQPLVQARWFRSAAPSRRTRRR